MERLFVTADDRTGALEVAGALADRRGRPVRVVALAATGPGLDAGLDAPADPGDAGDIVVDLGSRHADPGRVVELIAAAADHIARPVTAHKFDSTLRGNWAGELVELHHRSAKRVLVVPALPAAGRVCHAGVVLVDGVPVAQTALGRDPRRSVSSSRPADHLLGAGASAVASIADDAQLASWLAGGGPAFAVADAVSDDDLERIAQVWRGHRTTILLAGTSDAIARGVGRAVAPNGPTGGHHAGPLAEAVLVVCGSLHRAARRQVARLAARVDDNDRVAIITTSPPWPPGAALDDGAATAAVVAVAARAWRALQVRPERVVIVLGGDTADALLGDDVLQVEGTLGPGVAWSYDLTRNLRVATRAGGFGHDDALVELVARLFGHDNRGSVDERPGTMW